MSLLELHDVTKLFPVRRGFFGRSKEFVRAVDDASLSVSAGEVVGLVGESASGKSTLARIILRLIKPSGGKVIFDNTDITELSGRKLLQYRKKLQAVFQDPFSSLNPRLPAGDIVTEPLVVHKMCKARDRYERAKELFKTVGLDENFVHRYPHEFSGGQRQRISIARAISLKPSLIILDEPVSSLDVSIQADILRLFNELQISHNLSYLFITHDLRIVNKFCTRVLVMHQGRIVEELPAGMLLAAKHPYTLSLLKSVPNVKKSLSL